MFVYITYIGQIVCFGPFCHVFLGIEFLTDCSEKFATSNENFMCLRCVLNSTLMLGE
jgi:hypothetical protein